MSKKKVIILGAGISGLSAAWHLQRNGMDCRVFEKESDPGGLCRSKNCGGFVFDCDGHLLHFKHRYAFDLVKNLLNGNIKGHSKNAWVYSGGIYSRYPFQANLHGLPEGIVKECLLGFIRASKNGRHKKDKSKLNFLEWIHLTFGKGIAKHFMIPYNKKFWTLSPAKMNCEWLDGFIPVPSLKELVEGAIQDSRRRFGYNAYFWYPKNGGISQLAAAFYRDIKNVYTDCEITQIDIRKKEIRNCRGNKDKFDYLIYAIPLPELPGLAKGLPAGLTPLFNKLRWNSIFNLNLGLDRKEDLPRHWVYFPREDTCFFRVGFFHNFSACAAPADKSALYTEVAYSKEKPIDKNKIVQRIKRDLIKVGLLSADDRQCCQDINDIEYGYPIYDKNYNGARGKILGYLEGKNIIPCGRYGSWRYFSMEDAIMDGKRVADLISKYD